jgi:hypothetical protein
MKCERTEMLIKKKENTVVKRKNKKRKQTNINQDGEAR